MSVGLGDGAGWMLETPRSFGSFLGDLALYGVSKVEVRVTPLLAVPGLVAVSGQVRGVGKAPRAQMGTAASCIGIRFTPFNFSKLKLPFQ